MTSKNKKLDDLFKEWVERTPEYKGNFTNDGIIDEQLYLKTKLKILFITKEPNKPKKSGGDFREWLNQELVGSFSYRIAEWSYGILNNFPPYDKIWKKNSTALEAIKRIAFMNVKKSGGSGNSNYNEMIENVENNINFIHQEIDIISPNIIITGVTWRELRDKLFPKVKWVKSGYYKEIGRYGNSKIIDFYHPSSRTAPAASYSLLQNIVNSAQFKQL